MTDRMGTFQRKTNFAPTIGVVIYVNPVNLKDIRPAPVRYDPAVYERAKQRAADVFDLTKTAKDFVAEGKISGNDCNYCDFCSACNKVDMDRYPSGVVKTETLSEKDQIELEALTRRVVDLRAKHKKLEEDKKAEESALKEKLLTIVFALFQSTCSSPSAPAFT